MKKESNFDVGLRSDHYIQEVNGVKYFVKKYLPRPKISLFQKLEKKVFPKTMFHNSVLQEFDSRGTLEQEVKTWKLWKDFGVPTLDLISVEGKEVVWNYLEAESLRMYLEKAGIDEEVFDNYLEVYTKIRHLAKENNNTDLLHNDPWFKNYLVHNKQVIPIDAGIKLNLDFSLEELDNYMNRLSLCSIAHLNILDETKKVYFEKFRETLTQEEVRGIMNFNFNPNLTSRIYWGLKGEYNKLFHGKEKKNVFGIIDDFNLAKKNYMGEMFKI
ncbi:hypothetical protein HOD29_04220 [archaeon]|jgi:tRNA A-37 threonylcarbamoyl transferase component Bud32|nr:hypothetical protein [archaeon]